MRSDMAEVVTERPQTRPRKSEQEMGATTPEERVRRRRSRTEPRTAVDVPEPSPFRITEKREILNMARPVLAQRSDRSISVGALTSRYASSTTLTL
jgi:hypothetical protein